MASSHNTTDKVAKSSEKGENQYISDVQLSVFVIFPNTPLVKTSTWINSRDGAKDSNSQ
jgi:hypothetical protein